MVYYWCLMMRPKHGVGTSLKTWAVYCRTLEFVKGRVLLIAAHNARGSFL